MVRVCSAVLVLLSLLAGALLHSGNTDGNGGHYDSSTGTYHFHHGYPAHQHRDTNGDGKPDCPYDFKDMTSSSGGGGYYFQSDTETSAPDPAESGHAGEAMSAIVLVVAFVSSAASALLLIDQKRKYESLSCTVQTANDQIHSIVRSRPDPGEVPAPQCNYARIDDTISRERSLEQCVIAAQAQYSSDTERVWSKTKKIALVHAISMILFLAAFLYRTLIEGDVWRSLLVALVLSAVEIAVVGAILASGFSAQDSSVKKQMKEAEQKASRDLKEQLTKSYADRRAFLGIPNYVRFVDELPVDTIKDSPLLPYGTMTRFVSVSTGKRFHLMHGCSGATFPVHLYPALLGERYSYCSKCAASDARAAVPQWYLYHLKLNQIETELQKENGHE